MGDVVILKHVFRIEFMSTSCTNVQRSMQRKTFNENVNIGPGKELVLSGNGPLPEAVLAQIYVAK